MNRAHYIRALAAGGLAGLASAGHCAGTLYVISSNGPPSQQYNVVVLAEGYRSTQLTEFRADATNALAALINRQPFQEYSRALNTYAIALSSVQAGSDHPAYGLFRDTYFNSSYDASDRMITIPSGTSGQLKVEAVLREHVPDWNVAILLVNDVVPGGSDGAGKTAICSKASIRDVLIHEVGHTAAGLGDEYTTPNPGYPDVEEANTTRQTNRVNIKWKAWIAPETPVPTPPTDEFSNAIGLFEGAHYHATGWYRPKLNCTMQSQYTADFCEVCREALTLALFEEIKPAKAVSPATSVVSINDTNRVPFTVVPFEPQTHSMSVGWALNGVPVATGPVLSLFPGNLFNGSNYLTAVVTDPTPFVRTDPGSSLKQTFAWPLSVDLPAPLRQVSFKPPLTRTEAGGESALILQFTGATPQVDIEVSTNLVTWSRTGTVQLSDGLGSFTNSVSQSGNQFFRARSAQ